MPARGAMLPGPTAGTTGATAPGKTSGVTGSTSARGRWGCALGMSTIPEPRIETVVLQPTPFCNIDCKYCYLPDRSDRTVMKHDTVVAAFERIFSSGWASPN